MAARKPDKRPAADGNPAELAKRALELLALDRAEEAEPLALAAVERLLGKRSPTVDEALLDAVTATREVAARLHAKALAALAGGEQGRAEPLCRRAIEALAMADPVHQALIQNKGASLARASATAEAVSAPTALDLSSVQATHARSLRGTGRLADAARVLKQAVDSGAADEGTRLGAARASVELGELYRELGRPGEAGPCYRRALVLAERACGPSSPELVPFLEELARFSTSQKETKDARRHRERAKRITEATRSGVPIPSALSVPPTPIAPTTPAGEALAKRVAEGSLSRENLELAAYAGDEAARDALGGGAPFKLLLAAPPGWITPRVTVTPDILDLEAWVGSAWRWPGPLAVHLAIAAAELALPVWKAVRPRSTVHEKAIAAARAFVDAPGESQRAPLQKAGEACVELALDLSPGFKRAGNYRGACSGAFLAETCHSVLDGGRPFQGAAAVVQEAKLELAWVVEEKKRTGASTAKALGALTVALRAAAVRWALGEKESRGQGVSHVPD